MPFPPPGKDLLAYAAAENAASRLRPWLEMLHSTAQSCLERWSLVWTGEWLRQGAASYVLACRRPGGTPAILKLTPDVHRAREEATALSAWEGIGAAPLLAEFFDENGAALLIGRIDPGRALQPLDDPAVRQIARCIRLLHRVPAIAICRPLPSGHQRLIGFMQANACHIDSLSLRMRQGHSKITALAEAIGCAQRPQNQAVLLHGDLHARNLLINNEELVAIDPIPSVGEPEQDIAEAVAKNDWGPDLHLRAKQLAEACDADHAKVAAYTRVAAWNAGLFHAGTGAETPGGVDPDELLAYAVQELK